MREELHGLQEEEEDQGLQGEREDQSLQREDGDQGLLEGVATSVRISPCAAFLCRPKSAFDPPDPLVLSPVHNLGGWMGRQETHG